LLSRILAALQQDASLTNRALALLVTQVPGRVRALRAR
jgi:hypothetical protein